MIRELDTVVLAKDLKIYSLKRGDVGAVVHCYADGKAFEVEFVTGDGKTIAVLRLRRQTSARCVTRRFFMYALLHQRRGCTPAQHALPADRFAHCARSRRLKRRPLGGLHRQAEPEDVR
jgi:hypothetical protein